MRVRTLLFVVLLLTIVLGAAKLFEGNRDLLKAEFQVSERYSLPVGVILVLSIAVGALVVLLFGVAREIGLAWEQRRSRRVERKQEEIEERYTRGLGLLAEGRDEDALGQFRAVLEQDSRHFNTLLKIGDVLRAQERFPEAIEYHRKAHHLREEDARPLYALVEDHEAMGDLDRARAVLARILGINKTSVTAWRKLRDLHVKQRNWDKALESNDRVLRLAPRGSRDDEARRYGVGIRYEAAVELLAAGRPKDALGALRKILKAEPRFVPAHVAAGDALLQLGQENDAVAAWHQGFESTGSPVLLTRIEELYLGREQPVAAIEALKHSVSASRRDTLPRLYLGKLYFRLEMLDDALAVLSSIEGRTSHAPTLHLLLARIHDRRKNYREAAAEYRRIVKELDLGQYEYRCRGCGERHGEWTARCATCGAWNAVETDLREEMSLEELGIAPAPVYSSGP